MPFYEDREIENERVELTDKDSLYVLGSNETFRMCTLLLEGLRQEPALRQWKQYPRGDGPLRPGDHASLDLGVDDA
jgi:hypothetical protein